MYYSDLLERKSERRNMPKDGHLVIRHLQLDFSLKRHNYMTFHVLTPCILRALKGSGKRVHIALAPQIGRQAMHDE